MTDTRNKPQHIGQARKLTYSCTVVAGARYGRFVASLNKEGKVVVGWEELPLPKREGEETN